MSRAQWRFGQQSPNSVSEIIVPTCSYRMGSNNIGYGVLTIGKNVKHEIIIFSANLVYLVVKNYHLNLLCMYTCIVMIRLKL